jgi:AcrR family transcriptional regulator
MALDQIVEKHPKGRRRAKDFDASRADFLRSAYEILAEKGYHQTSVDEIVKRAARSKGGFYHHFRSKEELYLELFDQMIKGAGEQVLHQFHTGKSVREVLVDLIDRYEPMMKDPQRMVAAVDFYHLAIRNEDVKKVIRDLQSQSVLAGEIVFKEAISRGEFESIPDITGVVEMMFAAGRGLMVMSVILDGGEGLSRRLRAFVDQQLRAVETKR